MARAGVTFEVLGVRDLGVDLDGLRDEIRTGLGDVMRETALSIRDNAAFHAPRDRGDLADAIQAQGKGLSWRVGIVDERIESRGGTNSAHLNPAVYGVWYEVGFISRHIRRHRFMGPAVEHQEPIFNAAVDHVMEKALP
jgi:hypothetical protein